MKASYIKLRQDTKGMNTIAQSMRRQVAMAEGRVEKLSVKGGRAFDFAIILVGTDTAQV